MNFFTRLFLGEGSSTAAKALADSAEASFELIDEAFDTDQEKREHKQKVVAQLIEARKAIASDGNAEARFWFLQQITNICFALCGSALIASLCKREDLVKTVLAIADTFYLGWAFSAAITFFFLVDVSSAAGIKLPTFKK